MHVNKKLESEKNVLTSELNGEKQKTRQLEEQIEAYKKELKSLEDVKHELDVEKFGLTQIIDSQKTESEQNQQDYDEKLKAVCLQNSQLMEILTDQRNRFDELNSMCAKLTTENFNLKTTLCERQNEIEDQCKCVKENQMKIFDLSNINQQLEVSLICLLKETKRFICRHSYQKRVRV